MLFHLCLILRNIITVFFFNLSLKSQKLRLFSSGLYQIFIFIQTLYFLILIFGNTCLLFDFKKLILCIYIILKDMTIGAIIYYRIHVGLVMKQMKTLHFANASVSIENVVLYYWFVFFYFDDRLVQFVVFFCFYVFRNLSFKYVWIFFKQVIILHFFEFVK